MAKFPEMEAFIHNWTSWAGPVAIFDPQNKEARVFDWRFCEAVYTLVPLDGRHQDATYRLRFTFNSSPTETEARIGQRESTIELPLQTEIVRGGFTHFKGRDSDGNRLLELRCDQDGAEEYLGEVTDYDTITVQLEYQEALLERQAHLYDSLNEARDKFVDYIDRYNNNENLDWDNDPQAIFDPDSDGLSGVDQS
jgi:hypothetical protein